MFYKRYYYGWPNMHQMSDALDQQTKRGKSGALNTINRYGTREINTIPNRVELNQMNANSEITAAESESGNCA